MTRQPIQGFVPAIVTPFDERGEIRYDDFGILLRWLLEIGAEGVCIAGDNGESWALMPEERRMLVRAAHPITQGRVPLILGASAQTTRQAIKYAEIAAEEGADAILLMPQTYVLKATRAELVAHYKKVARAVDIPIVAYNSPRRSGIALSVDDLEAVCDAAPVVALKESTRDIHHFTHVIRRLGDRIAVMTGPAPFILVGAALGAKGFISSGPELLGKAASRLMAMGRAAPDDEYRRVHNALTLIYETLMKLGTWPAALKAALYLIGKPAGVPRDPVQPLSEPDISQLAALVRSAFWPRSRSDAEPPFNAIPSFAGRAIMKAGPAHSLRMIADRGAPLEFFFDGRPVEAYEGETIAMALWAAGAPILRKSPRQGAPRGVLCAMGACQECVVVVHGRLRPSCMTAVAPGLDVRSAPGPGEGTSP
jgi:4-hydroxy-tetrahydrodipicolinate synthase